MGGKKVRGKGMWSHAKSTFCPDILADLTIAQEIYANLHFLAH